MSWIEDFNQPEEGPSYNTDVCYGCGSVLRGSFYCPKCRDGWGQPAPKREAGWFAVGYQEDGTISGALLSFGPFETEALALEAIATHRLHGSSYPGLERVPFVHEVAP